MAFRIRDLVTRPRFDNQRSRNCRCCCTCPLDLLAYRDWTRTRPKSVDVAATNATGNYITSAMFAHLLTASPPVSMCVNHRRMFWTLRERANIVVASPSQFRNFCGVHVMTHSRRILCAALCCLGLVLTFSASAVAEYTMTVLTFSSPVQLPTVLLPVGTYRLTVNDGDAGLMTVTRTNGRFVTRFSVSVTTRAKAGDKV
jgi:hypothetical protein